MTRRGKIHVSERRPGDLVDSSEPQHEWRDNADGRLHLRLTTHGGATIDLQADILVDEARTLLARTLKYAEVKEITLMDITENLMTQAQTIEALTSRGVDDLILPN
eukprot:COSAG06_NODE_2913_length_6099_cov_4.730500_3_plen_106_part_00